METDEVMNRFDAATDEAVDLFDAVVHYETYLWNYLDAHLRRAGGVLLGTLSGLRAVHHHPGTCRVQEISADIGITVGAASKFVDRLERDGLVVRSAHPDDRRSSLVALTPAGQAAHDAGIAVVEAALAEHLAGQEISTTTAVLQRLLARLAPSAPAASAARP